MAILHGSWLSAHQLFPIPNTDSGSIAPPPIGALFLWAETWRSATGTGDERAGWEIGPHPLAMTQVELAQCLTSWMQTQGLALPDLIQTLMAPPPSKRATQQRKLKAKISKPQPQSEGRPPDLPSVQWSTQVLSLPVTWQGLTPVPNHSRMALTPETERSLHPVRVEGLVVKPALALEILNQLPLNLGQAEDGYLGDDLRFWSHVTRWGLDLLVRAKFLPQITRLGPETCSASWSPLLDSAVDRTRYQHFCQHMPPICRTYQGPYTVEGGLQVNLPLEPGPLLMDFLHHLIDVQVRPSVDAEGMLMAKKQEGDPLLGQWLQALGIDSTLITAPEEDCDRLMAALETWTQPIQQSLQPQEGFRTCFSLQPPAGRELGWTVEYWLQALDDPNCLISAGMVWSTPADSLTFLGRKLVRPQETLLRGLGLASRVYAVIEDSLQEARPVQHILTPTQAYDFLKTAAWRLEDSGFGVILPPSLANREGWAHRLGLQIKAQALDPSQAGPIGLDSLLNFQWELAIGGQTLSKAEFDALVAQDSPLVEINGEWVELRPQDVRAAQSFFAARQHQTGLSLQDALRISTGDTLTLEKLPVVGFEASGPLQQLLTTLKGNQAMAAIPEPEGFRGELRPYQSRGVGWLSFLEQWGLGACLADDMGLGKTIQFIAFLLHLKEQGQLSGPTLLICPTSVLGNWEREVHRFAPSLKVLVHHGSGRSRGKGFAQTVKPKDLVLTSYPLVHRDQTALAGVKWWGLVLDEAQNIKNSDARQSRAVRQLQAQFRLALTGTPLENRLTELWSILDFLNPGYLGPKPFFQRRFATPIERYGDTASLQTLRALVQPFILRRTKTDRDIIQDLPEKQEMTVFCSLTPEQASLYEQTVQASLEAVEAATGIQRHGVILATLVKLKQICNHPAHFLKENTLNGPVQRSGKLKRLEEMLEEVVAEGDRALIFTQFAEWGKLLQKHLQQVLGREALLLYGGVSKQKREEMIDRFQHDPQGPRLFILSLKAGGVGLNLTRANHVFHFDRWWNPAVENQATDRVFRIGQTRNVQVHKFVCTGTLEEKIHEQLESKKALAEQVVGAGENWLADLDTKQLRQLLLLDRSAVIDEDA